MAVVEHEITQQEVTQSLTVRLTETQAAKLREAATAEGQSIEEFALSALARGVETVLEPRSTISTFGSDPLDRIFGIFKDEPLMDALMERIHAEQRAEIEAFKREAEAEG